MFLLSVFNALKFVEYCAEDELWDNASPIVTLTISIFPSGAICFFNVENDRYHVLHL